MSDPRGSIRLTVITPLGDVLASAVNVEGYVFEQVYQLPPAPIPEFSTATFDDAVTLMRRKQFRKEELRAAALQLAAQIIDRLEDKEGWHGIDRQESAQRRKP